MAAGPDKFTEWARGGRVDEASADRGDGIAVSSARGLRFAFAGRTSTADLQDPTLSIPRQLTSSEIALPANAEICAYFYDIESGRMNLSARGHGHAHEQFEIPVSRDGGIQDLLAEARRPDRRFDFVICESIERISRFTHTGTTIEHELQQQGVRPARRR